MRLSTKSRFAVNAMIDLALREQAGPVALAAIGNRQQISLSYLEQLFSRLRRDGLVESTRGPGGGYTLGRAMEDISVADIVGSVEGPADETDPAESRTQLTRDLWQRLDQVMQTHMAGITLRELVLDQRDRGVEVEDRPTRRAGPQLAPRPPVRVVPPGVPNSVFALAGQLARSPGR